MLLNMLKTKVLFIKINIHMYLDKMLAKKMEDLSRLVDLLKLKIVMILVMLFPLE